MRKRTFASYAATALTLPLLVVGLAASPAHADATVGDPALDSYPTISTDIDPDPAYTAMTDVPETGTPCGNNGADETHIRADILTRARSWLAVSVPYSQALCYQNQYGDYRADCSGFVSMAWGIGGLGSDIWTGNILTKSHTIARSDLQPGDALLRHTGNVHENHVALFVKWYDSAHTEPLVMEQTGSRDTVQDAWSQSNASLYTPIRYNNVDDSTATDTPADTVGDYNGDGQTDRVVYRPSTGEFYVQYYRTNGTGIFSPPNPAAGDIAVPGDYNADGLFDFMVFNPASGQWKLRYHVSDPNATAIYTWGQAGDIPVGGDYDGDGHYDRVVYRPSTGQWLLQYYAGGTASFEPVKYNAADVPVPGDYNADGKADFMVFNANTGQWKLRYHVSDPNATAIYTWGQAGDIPVGGDYDGDGHYDRAVYRPSTAQFLIQYYAGGTAAFDAVNHASTDVPVPGDFNGDGKADFAVFNPATGEWKIRYHISDPKQTAIYTWGTNGDIPATQ